MRPVDLQQIGGELAIKWPDGGESFIPLEKLRRHCPCAGCQGETDIMGNVYKNPEQKLTAAAFELDGEWIGKLPATFSVAPQKLRVVVP